MKLLETIEQWEKNGTDGPWLWTMANDNGTITHCLSPGVFITEYSDGTLYGDEIDQANANLISLAPDMAKALKAAVELADSVDVMNEIAGQQALANLMRDLKAFREAMG